MSRVVRSVLLTFAVVLLSVVAGPAARGGPASADGGAAGEPTEQSSLFRASHTAVVDHGTTCDRPDVRTRVAPIAVLPVSAAASAALASEPVVVQVATCSGTVASCACSRAPPAATTPTSS